MELAKNLVINEKSPILMESLPKDWWYLAELLRKKTDASFFRALIGVASEERPIEKRFLRVQLELKNS